MTRRKSKRACGHSEQQQPLDPDVREAIRKLARVIVICAIDVYARQKGMSPSRWMGGSAMGYHWQSKEGPRRGNGTTPSLNPIQEGQDMGESTRVATGEEGEAR